MTFIIFCLFGLLTIAGAICLVASKNPMHSVLYLAFTVLTVAGVFFTLQADFLGAIQIMVYAGGIVVLYVFVIIIINLNQLKQEKRAWLPKLFLIAIPLLLAAELFWTVTRSGFKVAERAATGIDFITLAKLLLSTYVIPFEIASVLLLAVLIGSIIVAKRKVTHDSR